MFDWEHGISLHTMQGIWASSPAEGCLMVFLELQEPGYILELQGDGHSKLHLVQRSQESCLVRTDTSGI